MSWLVPITADSPGRLNGQCSGAVRMNGWPLSSHDNLLPTHCSNPPPGPLIWLLLILLSFFLSFSSLFHLSLYLSPSQICLPWPRRSSWRRWPVTTATSNMAGQTERTGTTTMDWVSGIRWSIRTHAHASVRNV